MINMNTDYPELETLYFQDSSLKICKTYFKRWRNKQKIVEEQSTLKQGERKRQNWTTAKESYAG